MDLMKYFAPLRKWWWLLVIAGLIAGVSSYLAMLRQPPIYQTLTTLMVGQLITDPNPTDAAFNLRRQLAVNYADIANREPVRIATKEALGLMWMPDYQATALPDGQFIEIVVSDTVPARAQAVANELARQLILRSPFGNQSDEQIHHAFVQTQLDNLQAQITETEIDIQELGGLLGEPESAHQIEDMRSQITALEAKLTELQGIYADLLSNTRSGAVNTISVSEEAYLPEQPISPNKFLTLFLSVAVGLSLASLAAYLLEYMDDTIKGQEEVEKLTNAPVIGRLTEQYNQDVGALYVAENPRHPSVEEIRTLRANIEFVGVDQPINTILVSSAEMGVGKTSVAANLAAAMSQAEKDVILIDGDLRRPNVHNYYGFQNNIGLSDLFRGELSVDQVINKWPGGSVSVITAGEPPPNPSELLGSRKMSQILESLTRSFEIVIIDGPPFVVADAPILASKVNGVLLIIQLGKTRIPSVKGMMEQINQSGAKVVGVVLNRLSAKNVEYYTGSPKYISYYTDNVGKLQRRKQPKFSFWPFNRRAKSDSGPVEPRVFNEIDIIEGEGDGFGWSE